VQRTSTNREAYYDPLDSIQTSGPIYKEIYKDIEVKIIRIIFFLQAKEAAKNRITNVMEM
jgi:hypothetical protein